MQKNVATCCRMELVQHYCDKTARSLRQVADDMADVLENCMSKKTQADKLRQLMFSKLCSYTVNLMVIILPTSRSSFLSWDCRPPPTISLRLGSIGRILGLHCCGSCSHSCHNSHSALVGAATSPLILTSMHNGGHCAKTHHTQRLLLLLLHSNALYTVVGLLEGYWVSIGVALALIAVTTCIYQIYTRPGKETVH